MANLSSKLILLLSAFLFIYPHSSRVHAEQNMTISVGEWPPYISQDQKHKGIISHLISDIFTDMGIKVSFEFLPWTRAYNETKHGRYQATAIWMEKAERKIDFIYSSPILTEQFVFFHHKRFLFEWETIDDIKKINTGVLHAYSYGTELDKVLSEKNINKQILNRPEQGFEMLLRGRIDILPMEVNVGKSTLKKYFTERQYKRITYHEKPFLNNSSFLLFPKSLPDSKGLSERFNQHLQKFKDNGQYDEYFGRLDNGYYETSPQESSSAL